jgi:hypothetical protein
MATEYFLDPKPFLSIMTEFDSGGTADTNKNLNPLEAGKPQVSENDPAWHIAHWHSSINEFSFKNSSFENIIKFTVRFKGKNAYGTFNNYLVKIERQIAENVYILDSQDIVMVATPPGDHTNWYYKEKEYSITHAIQLLPAIAKVKTQLIFKITANVTWGRHHDFTPNPGSQVYKATFDPPKLGLARERLQIEREAFMYASQHLEKLLKEK